jgi:hypothetical protein
MSISHQFCAAVELLKRKDVSDTFGKLEFRANWIFGHEFSAGATRNGFRVS